MHHQVSGLETHLKGLWTFDAQNGADSSLAHNNLVTLEGTPAYLECDIDLAPPGEAYLVAQAQLMQDYVWNSQTQTHDLMDGYRVLISAKDALGNPFTGAASSPGSVPLTIWASDAGDGTVVLHFMDGTSATITATSPVIRNTNVMGELSFVIDAQAKLHCPSLKVNAGFMAIEERLLISPDRHVHATLATITADQLSGQAPLPSGKTAALFPAGSGQIGAAATAISSVMKATLDRGVQAERHTIRKRSTPIDSPRPTPYVPRYQNCHCTQEIYDPVSNTVSCHFLNQDHDVAHVLVAGNMADPYWSLNLQQGSYTALSPEGRDALLAGKAVPPTTSSQLWSVPAAAFGTYPTKYFSRMPRRNLLPHREAPATASQSEGCSTSSTNWNAI